MTESKLSIKLRNRARERGAWCVKTHGGAYSSGLPDLIGCLEGRLFGFEVKLPGRRHTLTKLQAATLREMSRAGALAGVITTLEELDAAFDQLKRITTQEDERAHP